MSFEADFNGMLPDTLTFDVATVDETGELTAAGSPTSIDCYIQEETKLVMDARGQEVVSNVQVFVGVNSLTVDGHLYTIPARFSVSANREAISVDHYSDENGAYAEEIQF